MTSDVFDDLAEELAAEPGPDSETVEVMRQRLLAAAQAEIGTSRTSPGRGRVASRGRGYFSGTPERVRFALSVVAITVLVVAVFVVPVPQLFHFGPGSHNRTVVSSQAKAAPVSVARLVAGRWSTMSPEPIVPGQRPGAVVIWTGRELIIWGGLGGSARRPLLYGDGAAYDPTTNTWDTLAPSPLSPRSYASAVWTGKELVIFGGYTFQSDLIGSRDTNTAAAYNPSTNTWRMLAPAPLTPRARAMAFWTGRAVMVLGGTTASAKPCSDGALFEPSSDTWKHISAPRPPEGHQLNWQVGASTGDELLAFSDWSENKALGGGSYALSGGADLFAYSFATGRWRPVPTPANAISAPQEALWTGRLVVVRGAQYNCGACSHPPEPEATDLYDPGTNTWTTVTSDPLAMAGFLSSLWTGKSLFSFDPDSRFASTSPGAASLYDPRTGHWLRLSTAPFGCDGGATPIWAGDRVVIYCPQSGSDASVPSGLIYTPAGPTGPATLLSAVPAGFDPLSLASLGADELWVLGSVSCRRSQRCPVVVRTTDAGRSYSRIGAPGAGVEVGNELFKDLGIVFADASHGWIYGPGLFSTDDGGTSWTNLHVQGTVMDLAASNGELYALVCTRGLSACLDGVGMELMRAPQRSGALRAVRLPARLDWGSTLVLKGRTVIVMSGLGKLASVLMVSTDGGARFTVKASSCVPGLSGAIYGALIGAGVLWESCPTGMQAEAWRSSDEGTTWQAAGHDQFTNGLEIGPLSTSTALLWPSPPTLSLALTTDGGRRLRTVFTGELPQPGRARQILWAGFATSSRAYLIAAPGQKLYANQLWASSDGGVSWTEVRFSS